MKTLFSTILVIFLATAAVSAQNNNVKTKQGKQPISVETFTLAPVQTGNTNFQYSLTENDFNNKQFVFYTDSNATVAYMKIDGFTRRFTGGANPEHIMTYTGGGYTITLSFNNNATRKIILNEDDRMGVKSDGSLAIYNNKGQVVGEKVTGMQVNAVKK